MTKKTLLGTIVTGLLVIGQALGASSSPGSDEKMQALAERIVSPYKAVMNEPPRDIPNRTAPVGPLLGNGSLGTVITAQADAWPLQFWVMKSNFSKLRHDHRKGGPRPFGWLDVVIPALKDGTWQTENPQ